MLNINDIKALMSNNKYPCYIRAKDSEIITYANEEFFKVFECDESIYQQSILNLIKIDAKSGQKIIDESLNEKHWEFIFYHNQTSKNYTGKSTLLSDDETVFCEYNIFVDKELDKHFEHAMARCMDIYQQPKDVLVSFMQLLCEFYDCNRAYVYSFNKETVSFNCVSSYANDDHEVVKEITKDMNSAYIINWIVNHNTSGLVAVNYDNPDLDKSCLLAKILRDFDVLNLTLCVVLDINNEVIGMVGLCNRKNFNEFFDRRLVFTIARFVAQNVSKAVVSDSLFKEEHRDLLTGLYNRIGYSRRLNNLRENPPKSIGVIFANINGLKFINENYGTADGDDFIRFIARQLKDFFKFEFFRMSGDEFIGLALGIEKSVFDSKVNVFYQNMRQSQNYDVSIGHAWDEGNYSLKKLVFESENIMYINKQEFYRNSERSVDGNRDSYLDDLLTSLENNEFFIYLQPQVNLKDGTLYGAEALIRKQNKEKEGLIPPDQFIQIYEQKSIIRHIDLFVVESVCKTLSEWSINYPIFPVSVNLSRVTLQEFGIVDTIIQICKKYKIEHKYLVIEVTERVGLVENNVASSLIQSFKENGFHISLDDFGCAYSNIVTLAQIEVDEVKLDKSLVDDLTTSQKNHTLVKNVLSMCNELDKTSTLAEGIEDEEQASLLYELGCNLGQGYFYSRPIPVDEFFDKYVKVLV